MALLVVLDALLAEESVTGAAKRLGLSQPAMSAQLAKLRALLDDPVLVGDARGMTPTPRVAGLKEPLREHLGALRELVFAETPFDPASADRTFVIAAPDYPHAVVLPRLIAALRKTAPGVRIAALPFDVATAEDVLNREEADLIMTSERLMPDRLPARKLFDDGFSLAWRKGHPIGPGPIDLDRFCDLDHLLVSPSGGFFFGAIDQALKAVGRSRRVVASLPNFLLAIAALRQSDCIAVLPNRILALDPEGLHVAPPPVATPMIQIYQGWHPRMAREPGHVWLRQTITEVAEG